MVKGRRRQTSWVTGWTVMQQRDGRLCNGLTGYVTGQSWASVRNIYILCVSVVCQITWNHVNQTRACSKSVLGAKIRPVTPLLFVSTIC